MSSREREREGSELIELRSPGIDSKRERENEKKKDELEESRFVAEIEGLAPNRTLFARNYLQN